jgi:hypothetical protein
MDVCGSLKNKIALMAGTKVVRMVYPDFLETYKQYVHPCPFLPVNFFKIIRIHPKNSLYVKSKGIL